jgi:hypothetical protein
MKPELNGTTAPTSRTMMVTTSAISSRVYPRVLRPDRRMLADGRSAVMRAAYSPE